MNAMSFWENAEANPDRPAVIAVDGTSVSYGELASMAHRLANGLQSRGLKAGDTIALMAANRPEYFAVQLAATEIGLVLALINRHLTGSEAAYILTDAAPALFIADARTGEAAVTAAEIAGLSADQRFAIDGLEGFADWTELAGRDGLPADRAGGTVLLYSSGTTGKPKGILKPASGLAPEAEQRLVSQGLAAYGVRYEGAFLAVAPLYHSAPNTHAHSALFRGLTVVLARSSDPVHLLALIEQHRVVETFLVPTMMHRLITLPDEVRAQYDTSSLHTVLHAGAMCPVPVKRAMIEWLGPKLVEYYGATESGAVTHIFSADWLEHPGSVGPANPGMDVRIRDELGEPVPIGAVGLIHLRSGGQFEYHDDPAKTAGSHQEGYFIPGDMGYLDEDGYLYLADRRTDMIVRGGVNIYPAEIESVLLESPDVADAVVIGVPDDEWGQVVVALVTVTGAVRSDRAGEAERLRAECVRELAGYKVPSRIEVVDSLPRTPSGKLSRAKVRAAYAEQGAPGVAALA